MGNGPMGFGAARGFVLRFAGKWCYSLHRPSHTEYPFAPGAGRGLEKALSLKRGHQSIAFSIGHVRKRHKFAPFPVGRMVVCSWKSFTGLG